MLDLLLALREAGADVEAHAFHAHISTSKGTADMLGRLRKADVPYTLTSTASESARLGLHQAKR